MVKPTRFFKFSWDLLGPLGKLVTPLGLALTAAVALFGSDEQKLESNPLAQALSFAPWYYWAIGVLVTVLCFVLWRSYEIVERRTLGFHVLPNRAELTKAVGSLEQELEDTERVWMMCPGGMSLQTLGRDQLKRVERLILTRPSKEATKDTDQGFIDYAHMLGIKSLALRQQIGATKEKLTAAGCEVRYLPSVPIGIVIANPNMKSGWARLELLLPFGDASQRMSIIVYKEQREDLFNHIVNAFQQAWSKFPPDETFEVYTSAPSAF